MPIAARRLQDSLCILTLTGVSEGGCSPDARTAAPLTRHQLPMLPSPLCELFCAAMSCAARRQRVALPAGGCFVAAAGWAACLLSALRQREEVKQQGVNLMLVHGMHNMMRRS